MVCGLWSVVYGPWSLWSVVSVVPVVSSLWFVVPVVRGQWWIEGWATGAAAQGTKGGGHQRGESKNNTNLHDEKRD